MIRTIPVVKRLVLLVLLAVALVACSTDDDAALTVNGEEVLTVGELEGQLEDMLGHEDFLTVFNARGANEQHTLSSAFVTSSVLANHMFGALFTEELAAEGASVEDEDRQAGEQLLRDSLANAPQPLDLDDVPEEYGAVLREVYSQFKALSRVMGGDEAVQERLGELLEEVDVDVDGRFGRWDAEINEIVPPEGPSTPPTTALPLPTPE